MNTRKVGRQKEQIAAKWLEGNGCQIVESNFSCKYGEIDIVFRDGEYLVFGEVKYRRDECDGHPLEAVSFGKQKKISSASLFYLARNKISDDTPIRYDVIYILGNRIDIVKNAFEPILY